MTPSRIHYARLATERENRASRALDRLTPLQIAALMNREDRRAVRAVARVRGQIAAAVDAIVAAFRRGGRLFLDHVLQANEGADFDFLRGRTPVRAEDTAGPSHS